MDLAVAIFYLPPLFYFIFQICKLVTRWRGQCCYMMDYECYKPPENRKLEPEYCAAIALRNKNLGLEEYKFLLKTMVSSGIGPETYGPKTVISGREENPSLVDSLSEMDEIFYDTLDKLFTKSMISPLKIDILVVSVSLLSTVPSLTSGIINHYKMKPDIKAFNLAGMGCSASLVAIDLVNQLFKTHKNTLAVVVSTESLASNWYCGKERSMMLSNCLFRSGGCSMLFTNNRALKTRTILKLNNLERTHVGSINEAYGSCIEREDNLGYRGFHLSKYLTNAASQALSKNLRVLLPKVLPQWELLRYSLSTRQRKGKNSKSEGAVAGLNLKAGIEHFCIHPGGRAIIDGVGKSLGLSEYDLEPARMTLHRFGNTSSGGLWYAVGYMEAKRRLKKGDRILMISLGAGFKCNTCIWKVMVDLNDGNVWKDCVDTYPPKVLVNPYMEKCGWMNDECMSFIRFD